MVLQNIKKDTLRCSFGCNNLLNFALLTMKFPVCDHAIGHCLDIPKKCKLNLPSNYSLNIYLISSTMCNNFYTLPPKTSLISLMNVNFGQACQIENEINFMFILRTPDFNVIFQKPSFDTTRCCQILKFRVKTQFYQKVPASRVHPRCANTHNCLGPILRML